jgi:hypothetical protein
MVCIINNNFLHVCSWSKNLEYEIIPNYFFLASFPFLREEGRLMRSLCSLYILYDIILDLKPVGHFSRHMVWMLWDWRPICDHISNFLQSVTREHGGHKKLWDGSSTADTCFMLLITFQKCAKPVEVVFVDCKISLW